LTSRGQEGGGTLTTEEEKEGGTLTTDEEEEEEEEGGTLTTDEEEQKREEGRGVEMESKGLTFFCVVNEMCEINACRFYRNGLWSYSYRSLFRILTALISIFQ